jgi:hypothetical protein
MDDGVGQIEIGSPTQSLVVGWTRRRNQGRDIRHVDPQPVSLQTEGVIRVGAALIVDGKSREMG